MNAVGFKVLTQWFIFNREVLGSWLGIALSAATLLGLAGSALGLLLIIAYLNSVGAWLPVSDTSAAFVLLIVAGITCLGTTVIGLTLLFPALLCSVSQKQRQHIRRRRLRWDLPLRQRLEALRSQYLLFQSAPFALIASVSIGLAAKVRPALLWYGVGGAVIAGITISVLTFYWKVRFEERIKLRFGSRLGRMRARLAFSLVVGSAWRTFCCCAWFLSMLQFISVVPIVHSLPATGLATAAMCVAIGLMAGLIYWFLTSVIVRVERIPLIVLVGAVIVLLYDPSFVGRTALRALGMGGGIPALITIKTVDGGLNGSMIQKRIGCLIFNGGGQVIIHQQEHPTAESCDSALAAGAATPPKDVLSYASLNVLEITRYSAQASSPLP